VELATVSTWHVDPSSPARAPRPLNHTLIHVRLVGRAAAYRFPAHNSVEVQDRSWATASESDWAAAAMAAQEERAIRLLTEGLGATRVTDAD
jgi:hypothetical protein